ncbi:hypothetical protein QVD17_30545 [Tagetes erecta]|uniref:Uncharacterized protein n=1 Tax=Tagetes erecta TaxID=13708 RepID=A0AAD8K4C9_TARER|nr:hypothetical protein QVD17_30545 [Tagetes erecta]
MTESVAFILNHVVCVLVGGGGDAQLVGTVIDSLLDWSQMQRKFGIEQCCTEKNLEIVAAELEPDEETHLELKKKTDRKYTMFHSYGLGWNCLSRYNLNDIHKNPTFRSQFHEMCAKVGVDPLASNKGFWAELLGIGDFYYEIVVNSHMAPLINVLGSGFEVITVGKRKLVRSVPTELKKDHNEILELSQKGLDDGGGFIADGGYEAASLLLLLGRSTMPNKWFRVCENNRTLPSDVNLVLIRYSIHSISAFLGIWAFESHLVMVSWRLFGQDFIVDT